MSIDNYCQDEKKLVCECVFVIKRKKTCDLDSVTRLDISSQSKMTRSEDEMN